MKTLLLLFCYLLFISNTLVLGQSCTVSGITGNFLALRISDTQISTNIFTGAYNGELSIGDCTSTESHAISYFSITLDDTNFLLETTEEFGNFDKNTEKSTSATVTVNLQCPWICSGETSTLTVQIIVSDTNNHDPEFSKTTFELKVPSPIMLLTDIGVYGDPIQATDIDFSNQYVTFTIEPDDFNITTQSIATSKDYPAIFSARNTIQLTGNREYTLTVTDSGTPTRSSTAKLTITVDEELSLDSPAFEEPLYTFNYSVVNDVPTLTANDGSITLVTIKPDLVTDLELSGNYIGYFKTEFDASTRTINFQIGDSPIPSTSASMLIFTLSTTTDSLASTSIIVYLSADSTGTPEFSSHYYTGTYNDVTTSIEHETITLTSSGTPEVTLSGDYKDNFNIKYDATSKSYKISVAKSLSVEELKHNSYITLTIKATVDDYSDTAAIVITLPEHFLQFTEVLYSASYSVDHTVNIDADHPLGFTTDVTDVTFVVDDTYSKNFAVTVDSDSKQYTLSVVEHLSDDILKKEKEVVVTLTATDAYKNNAQTVVNIALPQRATDAPTFSETVYVANYSDGTLALGEDIAISNREDQSSVKITLDSYDEYFDIAYTDDKWVFKVLKNLPEDILTSFNEIFITLTAKEDNNDAEGRAVVIFNWYTKEAPQFTEEYYSGSYPESGEGDIDLDKDIGFSNAKSPENIVVQLDSYQDYFEVKYVSDKWVASVKKALDDDTLAQHKQLVIVLTAVEADNTNNGHSVLVIELPSTNPIQFADPYYVAEYPENGTGTIDFENPISLSNVKDLNNVKITLDNYADNFEIKYESDKWYVNIKKSLDDDIVKGNSELAIMLTASQTGKDKTAEATFLLKLPAEIVPKFSQAYYTADYPEDGSATIEFKPSLKFSNIEDIGDVDIVLDNYSDNFAIKFDTSKWYISIIKALDDDVILKNSELLITLIASISGSTKKVEATLAIKLPHDSYNEAPEFSKTYYTAQYPQEGTGTIEFEDPVELTNLKDMKTVTITLDNYADNFEIKYDTNKWVITIIKSLDDKTIKENSELVMTLTATEKGRGNTGEAVLILKLPVKVVPKFSAAYYTADYPENGTGTIEFEPSLELTDVDNPEDVVIILDKYTDNFEIKFDSSKWYISIKEALDDDIILKNSELLVTLIASTSDITEKGEATLAIKLPHDSYNEAPEFSKAYYTAQYPQEDSGTIEFEDPVEFTNLKDTKTVTITLDNYSDNFEIKYDTDKWVINIIKSLDDKTLKENSELVITLTATEEGRGNTGQAILGLKLPVKVAPKFSAAYYTADYPENGTGTIEFEPSLKLTNVDNPENVTIALDKYADNFEIKFDSSKWYIGIKKALDDDIILKNSELLITLIASTSGITEKGEAALAIELPHDSYNEAPEFSKAYYAAQYPQEVSGTIEFEDPVEFTNLKDTKTVTITLDNYSDNFEIKYDTDKWVINIIKSLDDKTLKENSELIITLTATEEGRGNTGQAVLVLKLPVKVVPKFSAAYYTADYPENGTGTIEFEPSLELANVDNPEDVVIILDKYTDNFEIKFESNKWYISIIKVLDDEIILKNSELLMTLIASTSSSTEKGEATLAIKLPHDSYSEGPEFSKAYYTAQYPQEGSGIIEFEDPIEFTNLDDMTTVIISLDNYADYFELVLYDTVKWTLYIKKPLDDATLVSNSELVMTLTASELGKDVTGESALVLKLPKIDTETGPKFLKAYYTASYPENGTGTINIEPSIEFSNVDNVDVTISLDKYNENFEIKYDSGKWKISIIKSLPDDVLSKNAELFMTLTASKYGISDTGETALVLNLPSSNDAEEPPAFSKVYYIAQYPDNGSGQIAFEEPIEFTNVNDPKSVTISLDNYADYFEITYDTDKWAINIKKPLDDSTLVSNSELVMILTASELGKDVTGESALVLKLPKIDTGTEPKFLKAYYTANYPETGSGTINIEPSIEFSNVDNVDVTIALDKYNENFEIIYDTNKWYINILNSLDDDTLAKNNEIIITLSASTPDSTESAQAALVINLPRDNDEEAPAFSKSYYKAQYSEEGSGTIEFEEPIEFTNINDPESLILALDNYSDNFEIAYNTDKWVINVKNALDDTTLNANSELVMTIIASQTGKDVTGQAALVMELPKADIEKGPKFSEIYYTADYPEAGTGIMEFKPSLEVSNVNIEDLAITLDKYSENFEVKYDTDKWHINILKSLDDDTLAKSNELIITLTASTSDNTDSGKAALVLSLPQGSDEEAPAFSKPYYIAQYPEEGSGTIEFADPISFTNVNDPESVKITLDNYSDNFEIVYNTDKWVINVKSALDDATLKANSELVMTITARQTGNVFTGAAALVLELPKVDADSGPKFSEVYYTADYPEAGTGIMEFKPSLEVSNVDIEDLAITLDKYSENFEVKYDTDKWHINILKSLDDDTLAKNNELIITLTASTSDNTDSGKAALVLSLPQSSDEEAPAFSKPYYIAQYPEEGSGIIEFEDTIGFTNINDPESVKITLDNYSDNFEIVYNTDKWVLNVKSALNDATLKANSELVMTITARQTGNVFTGAAALVLELPKVDAESGPKFSEVYYTADYPEAGTGIMEFKPSLEVSNVNIEDLAITLDKYSENFEVKYDTDKWHINILKSLDDDTLTKNNELIITLTASTSDNTDSGKAALVLSLPQSSNEEAPAFSKPYYIAQYPEEGSGIIEFEDPIGFTNVNDPESVKITLDNYSDNFEIVYNTDKWVIKVRSALDDATLKANSELVITITAKQTGNVFTGAAALVLELPKVDAESGPKFSEVYYTADYPEAGTGIMEFKPSLEVSNVNIEDLAITLDKYSENFEVKYDTDKWHINILKSLDDDTLTKNNELIITLTASTSDNTDSGKAALVLSLPQSSNEEAPAFSKPYYIAQYPEEGSGIIEFEDPIGFTNVNDPESVKITLDNYSDNFEIVYNTDKWVINVKSALDDATLKANSELVMTITARQTGNVFTGVAALVLELPKVDADSGPKFSEVYYTADYPEAGTGIMEFKPSLEVSNVDIEDLAITLDKYSENFEVKYDTDKWYINILKSLDDNTLAKNNELIITLTASTSDNTDSGKAALVLSLPQGSDEEAPAFSKPYYIAQYPEEGSGTIEFEDPIGFTNVNDPESVKITLDNYSDNFEIVYNTDKWVLNVKNALDDATLKANSELVMTITAKQTGNVFTGAAALVLELPKVDAENGPKFSEVYYTADYPEAGTGIMEFKPSLEVSNVDIEDLAITLDKYSENFEVKYDTDKWHINILKSLDDDTLAKNNELIITLTASTSDNTDSGKAALVLSLPQDSDEEAPAFSKPYYIAQYPEEGSGTIEFEDPIGFTNVDDPESVKITLDSYTSNFEVKYSDKWYINILGSLSDDVLQNNAELVITLIAKEDGSKQKSESTLVLQLPSTDKTSYLKFEQSFYVATYSESDSDLIDFEQPIAFDNIDAKLVAITLDTYTENFEVIYKDDAFHIVINKVLEQSVLHENEELRITLTATDTSGNEGKATLILQLPIPSDGRVLRFSEPYYLATYPEDGKSDIDFETAVEFLNYEDISDITIGLDNYADNFEVKYDNDNSKWYIHITTSLDNTVLQKNKELVIALVATESQNNYKAESALVLKFSTETDNDGAPIFSAPYYLADYPANGSGTIDFENPLEISNVVDQNAVTIDLDTTYAEYLEIKYESDKWHINILKSIDDSLLHKHPEIVITLTATESGNVNTGTSALVLRLPTAANDEAPVFSEAYYTAQYTEDDSQIIEFENPMKIKNIDDQNSVTITLDKNSENFAIKYEDDRWYIQVLSVLSDDEMSENAELVITLTATNSAYQNEGYSVLVLKLPSQGNTGGLQFAKAYYTASYPAKGKGVVYFDTPIEFLNVKDEDNVKITLDSYSENFEVTFDAKKWFLYVKKALDNTTLKAESEVIITLTAKENGTTATGTSAMIIKLPVISGLKFSEAYYLADYPESGTGKVTLAEAINFENTDDQSSVTIDFDNYGDNFEAQYESESWQIKIKKALDDEILKNTEIAITLTASQNEEESRSALVIRLPSSIVEQAPEFSDAYYLAKYPDDVGNTITFENDISFTNVDDPQTITIDLDNYSDYFEVSYTSGKWILNVQKTLESDILNNNKELIVTMTATEEGDENKGYSALVIELPTSEPGLGPIFSQAYYLADYPDEYTGTIEFQSPIAFDNEDDFSKISIKLDNFTDNFEIKLSDDVWLIKVKHQLDSSVLGSASELVVKLTATETDTKKEGYSTLVLRLPEKVAPIFSKNYYAASYESSTSGTKVVLDTPITITNQDQISDVQLSVDNYDDNFEIVYDSDSSSWVVNIITELDNDIITQKTDLVLAVTATNPKNTLTDHAAIDLTLPYLNTDKAPQFSRTYYTAKYTISDGKALVTFDQAVKITNRDSVDGITIGLDNYSNNFEVTYDETTQSWQMTVINVLDQGTLNRKIDLVMALSAVEKDNDENGQAVLLMRLPVVNTDDAPKFSSIFYDGIYTGGDTPSVTLEDTIDINNKEDPSTITISFDDSYNDNFEVIYNETASQWQLNIKSPLSDDIFKDRSDIVLTLTASETGNAKIGEAALVLHLPLEEIKLAPEFEQSHYHAKYVEEDDTRKVVLDDSISVMNKADLSKITITLDSYTDNFDVTKSSENEWTISVKNPLTFDDSMTELILTLIATEDDNVNEGKSTLIITLPSEEIAFSQINYSGSYSSSGELSSDDVIKVTTDGDMQNVAVTISGTFKEYFQVDLDGDSYKVTLKQELPSDALKENSLILVLEAALDNARAYATLVINLPSSAADGSITFSEALYSASYKVVDGKGEFTVEDTIKVETEEDATNLEWSISNSDGYDTYFEISYASNVITVTKEKDIPTDVLAKNSFIPLVLTVGIKGTSTAATSVLNVEINYDQAETSISFSNLLYVGKYEIVDGAGTLKNIDTITIDTEESDENINVVITNEYADFFNVDYSDKQVTVTLVKPLTDTIVNSSSVVPLTLQAEIAGTSIHTEAVVNIEIIYNVDDDTDSIEFGSVLYTGDYAVSGGKGDLKVHETINVISTSTEVEVSISGDSQYQDNFVASYADGKVSVELNGNLDDEIVKSNTFIPLTLTVKIKDTVHASSAVLNININSATRSASFSNLLYAGKYEVAEGTGTLTITDTISIDTEEPDGNINVVITNEYTDFFHVDYSDKQVTVILVKPLTDTIVNSSSVVPITLRAEITGTSINAEAVVNIAIIYDAIDDTDSILFGSVLYTGDYSVSDGNGELEVHEAINVISTSTEVEVSISDDSTYGEYFDVSYADNKVLVDVKNNLPDEVIQANTFITLTLEVRITGTVHESSAVLNINIPSDNNDDGSITFSNLLYNAKYEIIDNSPKLTFDPITVDTNPSDSEVEVSVTNEYEDYFSVAISEGAVTISITKELTEEIIKSQSVVPLILQAQIKGSTHKTSAIVNVGIKYDSNGEGDTDYVQFSSILYTGEYTIKDGEGSLAIADSIEIETNNPESEITVDFSEDSLYREYFTVTHSDKTVTVLSAKPLPSEATNSNFVSLTLNVKIQNTIHTSSAVLNIGITNNDDDDGSITFSNLLYNAKYEIIDNSPKLTFDPITVDTNPSGSEVEVSVTNEYEDYFSVAISEGAVTISIMKELTEEIINSQSVVPLILQAQIKGSTHITSAIVNVGIKYDTNGEGDTDYVQFSSILYTGEYTIKDGEGLLTIADSIKIETNNPESEITIDISEDSLYREYFTVTHSDKTVMVLLAKPLPSEATNSNFVSLTLNVKIQNTIHTSSAVLNIGITNDDDDGSITFSNLLYNAKYEIINNSPKLTFDPITVDTNPSGSEVEVSVTNEYQDHFSVAISEGAVTISIAKELGEDIINSQSVVPLVIQAQIKGSSQKTSAIVNVGIKYDNNGEGDTDYVQFTSILYTGEYTIKNEQNSLTINDEIKIETNNPESEIAVDISEDSLYREYFTVTYSDKTVTVVLAKPLPSDATNSNFVSLTLNVKIQNTIHTSSAVLNIGINNADNNNNNNGNDDEDSKTELHHLRITFIVVTAILSVLLLACIAGALAYYFLKIRSDNYANLEEDGSGRVRFGKNSLSRSPSSNKSSALEERRPTGFIFHPISEDMNSDSPHGTDKSRRKSVAFDDHVEKLQIDSVNDDDVDTYSSDKSQVTHV